MKKLLPFILLLVGALVFVGMFFIINKKDKNLPSASEEETALMEVALDDRPVISLIPSSDGHYLNLKIEKLNLINATSLDYKLEYNVPGSPDQGVPGTVKLAGKDLFEAELLLGSESSGKFRYDDGVENGTITLSYRNSEGKLLARFKTEFHLQSDTNDITSADSNFKYKIDSKTVSKDFFVTMNTVGIPKEVPLDIENGPYGIYSSSEELVPGTVSLGSGSIYYWNNDEWSPLENNEASDLGIFLSAI